MKYKRYNIKITEKTTGIVNDCDLTVPSLEIAIAIVQGLFNQEDFFISNPTEIPVIVHINIEPYSPN
jgi:hypothetical protein